MINMMEDTDAAQSTLSGSATWRICKIAPEQDCIGLYLEPNGSGVACPICGTHSRRLHSHYRRPWDVPWAQWPVPLVVHARRYFCDVPGCPRRIFVEPFPGFLVRYAQQTEHWRQVLFEVAHARSAEVAARVGRLLGFRASPDTLIRRQRAEPLVFPSPRVLGMHEFALRRGCRDGTLLLDPEHRQPIAVLERTAKPLTRWMQAHPTVAILVRDRADAYAVAGRQAVPGALQVADRFHLVHNIGDALKVLVHSRRWHQPTTATPSESSFLDASSTARAPPEQGQRTSQHTPRKRAIWETVQQRRSRGQSIRYIAQELGMDRKTFRKYLTAERPPVYSPRRPRRTQLDPYRSYLCHPWPQGCHNARRVDQGLIQRGCRGAVTQVRAAVEPWHAAQGGTPPRAPSLYWLLLRPATQLTAAEQQELQAILHSNPLLARGYQLKERFQALLVQQDVIALDRWLHAADASELPPFERVAQSFRQDYEPITVTLTTPWSTGQCEGELGRVKLLKRLDYGVARLDLLRQRILHRFAALRLTVKQRAMAKQRAIA
jgi:transposase